MTDEQDLRERLEHLELDGNQVANVLAIIAQAIADATAEQGREIDRLAALVERFGEAATFTREAIRDNLKAAQYKNEPLLLEAFNKCNDSLLCAASSRDRRTSHMKG
jgi:uncharacterized coiled-coil protein SlyX